MATIDFQRDVLERSQAVPVVVDFWAAWCGPCRVLGPVIEDLASQADGRWELAKVDTEAQPEVAQAFGIMSIPAVKMFHRGKVVAEFVGALPAAEIRRWLDQHLPDPDGDALDAIVAGWETRGAAIAPELETFLDKHPDRSLARLRLAQALVAEDPARARELIASADVDADLRELAGDLSSLADLAELPDDLPPRLAPHLQAARKALRRHDLDGTLENLVEAAMIDKRFGNELARRASVALFRLLGHDHELPRKHQSRLAMAIHS